MSEQYELHISWKGEEFPAIILFGDSRGTAFNSDKMVLTNLEGWNAPIYRKRITIEDPNGGVYADPVTTATQKLITINMSIFHKNNIDSWPLMQQVKALTDLDDFLELKLISIFDNEFKVVEILDNCYFVNAPTYEKKFGEHRYVMVIGSKDYDFKSLTTETIEPLPGEAGYEGQTDGEIGTGLQEGKVWDATTGTWVVPAPVGPQPGEAGYEGQTDGEVGIGLQAGQTWSEEFQMWMEPEDNQELRGGPYNGFYTTDPRDPRNFNSPSYAFYNNDPNYPGGTDPNNPASPYYNLNYVHVPDNYGGPFSGYYSDDIRDPRNFNSPGYSAGYDPNNPNGNWGQHFYNYYTSRGGYVWIPDIVGGPFNGYYSCKPHYIGQGHTEADWRDSRNWNHPNYTPTSDPNNPNGSGYMPNYVYWA